MNDPRKNFKKKKPCPTDINKLRKRPDCPIPLFYNRGIAGGGILPPDAPPLPPPAPAPTPPQPPEPPEPPKPPEPPEPPIIPSKSDANSIVNFTKARITPATTRRNVARIRTRFRPRPDDQGLEQLRAAQDIVRQRQLTKPKPIPKAPNPDVISTTSGNGDGIELAPVPARPADPGAGVIPPDRLPPADAPAPATDTGGSSMGTREDREIAQLRDNMGIIIKNNKTTPVTREDMKFIRDLVSQGASSIEITPEGIVREDATILSMIDPATLDQLGGATISGTQAADILLEQDMELIAVQDAKARRALQGSSKLTDQEINEIADELIGNTKFRGDKATPSEKEEITKRILRIYRRIDPNFETDLAEQDRVKKVIAKEVDKIINDYEKGIAVDKAKNKKITDNLTRKARAARERLRTQDPRDPTGRGFDRRGLLSETEMTNQAIADQSDAARRVIQERIDVFDPTTAPAPDTTSTRDPTGVRPNDPNRPPMYSTDVDLDNSLFDEQMADVIEQARLSADERIQRAGGNLGYEDIDPRASTFGRPTNETIGVGVGAGFGVLAGYGASQLVGNNPYVQAAVGGAVAEATTRVGAAATEAALARSSAVFAEQIATREAIQGAMLGAAEAGILSVALLPADMAYHHFLEQRINNPVLVNVIDAATFGTALTGLGVGVSAALAPETMGTSLIAGAIATGVGTIIAAFEGDKEARARREQEAAYQQALADQAAAQAEVDAIRTKTEARTRFLRTLPKYDYDFNKAWTAFDDKDGLGMREDDYGDWANNTRGIFAEVPKIPNVKQQNPNIDPETGEFNQYANLDTTGMTPVEAQNAAVAQNLYQRALNNAMIDRVCQEATGECNANLLAHKQRELLPEEVEFLNQQSAGLAFPTIANQVELQYQEFEMLHGRQSAARQEIKRLWDEDKIDIYLDPDEQDQLMIDRSNTSTNFTQEMQDYIRDSTQREIMAAYYHDGTKIDDIDPAIAAAASRYDEGYYQAINTFYNGMEYNANQLGLDIFQLMELQAIEHEDLWDYTSPANTGKGRRQMQAELSQMRAEKQLNRYKEMLDFNIENNPSLLVPDFEPITNPLDQMSQGIDRSNQQAIDDYNANLRAALSSMGAEYEQAVEGINNQRLYQGRTDLLFFQTADLYNRYRIDAIPTPDGGVVAQDNITDPTIANTAQQMKDEATNNNNMDNRVSYVDIQNYIETIDGYDQLSREGKRDMFNYYANNLFALPSYITDGKDIPLDQQKGRLAPVEKQVAQALTPEPVRQQTEPIIVDRAAPPTRARPVSPPPQPVPAPAPQRQVPTATINTPQGNITIAPTNA